jgi:hypothetical protein
MYLLESPATTSAQILVPFLALAVALAATPAPMLIDD